MCKKSLLMMLLFALFAPWAANAQSELTVYDGSATNGNVPVYGWYADAYNKAEMIMPAADLGEMTGGTISKMTWYLSTSASAAWGANYQVYLKEVDNTTFTTTFLGVDDATLVWEGPLDGTGSTIEIEFDNNYTYGGGNLFIAVYQSATGTYKSAQFAGAEVSSASISNYSYSGLDAITSGTASNFLPKTTFEYTPGAGVTCEKPTNLVVEYEDALATATWEGTASFYNIDINGTVTEGVTSPYTFAIEPNTTYSVKVQADCGGGDLSYWTSFPSFTTPCAAFALPHSYGFEDPDELNCWDVIATSSNTGISAVSDAAEGSKVFRFYYSERNAYLASPVFSGSEMGLVVTFQYMNSSTTSSYTEQFQVGYTTNASAAVADFTYGETIYGENEWVTYENTFPANTKRIAIKYIYTDGMYLRLDDFNFEAASSCPRPGNLAVNYESGTTATVSWTSDAASFNIDVNGEVTEGVTNPYTLSGLELATEYAVMVQAVCGEESSEWSNPVRFTTDDCMPEDMIIVNYALTDSYGDGWNGNYILVVDENCNIVDQLTITSGSSATGTVKVCGSVAQFMWYKGSYPDETSWVFTDANGEVLFEGAGTADMSSYDVLYTIDHNPYTMPTNIEAIEVGPYTAKIGWTETGTATAWQIGFFNNENELVNTVDANTNPYTVTGLDPETDYYVNVRATGANGTSLWPCLGYTSFTTLEGCAAPAALDVTPSVFSADVDWTAFEEGYDIEWAEVSAAKDGGLLVQYDDNSWYTSIGNTTAAWRNWGVKYPADMLQGNKVLTKIFLQENANFTVDSVYTINIYSGDSIRPTTLVATQNVIPGGEAAMREITLDSPVNIDPFQNLWITVRAYGTYIMTACQVPNPDNQWWDTDADGVWTNMGEDNTNLAGYGWMIRAYVEGYDPADFNWTSATGILPPYTIENLNAETTYMVRVKASCGTAWKWAQFTTHSACDAPTELEATDITYNAATLNWVGYQNSYNVQYREAAKYVTIWEDDFENGIGDEWTIIAGVGAETVGTNEAWYTIDPTGGLSFNAHSGDYCASSWSWNSSEYNANNWLITPQIDLQGILRYYVRTNAGYPDSYEVLLSTTTADTTSFTVTLKEYAQAPDNGEWNEVIIDLSAYAGQQGYIAIHHVDYDMNYLCIDDFGVYNVVEATAWIPATATETTLAINGLTPETEYEWQVQGINRECDGGLTEWSAMASFTTLPTQVVNLTAGWNWFSTYVEVDDYDPIALLQELEAALGDYGITIESLYDGSTDNLEEGWLGDLDYVGITNDQMYLINVTTDCTIKFNGAVVNPEMVEVTIYPEWNWVGYPCTVEMTLEEAFANFEPEEGDQIESLNDYAEYYGEWIGFDDQQTLKPGEGFLYYSFSEDVKTLVFPMPAAKAKAAQPVVKPVAKPNLNLKARKAEAKTRTTDFNID